MSFFLYISKYGSIQVLYTAIHVIWGRIPLGYPATNYQPVPNGTRSGGSYAEIESSGA